MHARVAGWPVWFFILYDDRSGGGGTRCAGPSRMLLLCSLSLSRSAQTGFLLRLLMCVGEAAYTGIEMADPGRVVAAGFQGVWAKRRLAAKIHLRFADDRFAGFITHLP